MSDEEIGLPPPSYTPGTFYSNYLGLRPSNRADASRTQTPVRSPRPVERFDVSDGEGNNTTNARRRPTTSRNKPSNERLKDACAIICGIVVAITVFCIIMSTTWQANKKYDQEQKKEIEDPQKRLDGPGKWVKFDKEDKEVKTFRKFIKVPGMSSAYLVYA